MSITNEEKRKQIVSFLKKELGGAHNVKTFSANLKTLGLCDLTDDKDLEIVTADGATLLQTLVSWFQLGLISKLIYIKTKIKGI